MISYNKIKIIVITLAITVSINTNALTVSPARIEISGNSGQTLSGEINIYNEQPEVKTFYTSYENFQSSDDSGAPKFIGSENGLATWIKTESSIAVNSEEKKVLPFTISIPADAEPGGYFAAVFLGSQPPANAEGGTVSIGGKIGILVLLRVNGDIKEGAGLAEFGTQNKKRFFSNLPISLIYKVNNSGGDRIVPIGDIKIKNTIRLNSATINLNEGKGSVLPGSVRKFEAVWGKNSDEKIKAEKEKTFFESAMFQLKNFHLGVYTAKINMTWGEGKTNVDSDSFTFFVIPWQLFLILFVVLLVVTFFGRIILRKYNKYIISQAKLTQ